MSDKLIPTPNSFQLPNIVVDYWMSRLSETQFKVLLAICRKTWGWYKEVDMISNAQIQEMTGFQRRAVMRACQDLVNLKLITCKANKNARGDADPNTYGVLTQNIYAGDSSPKCELKNRSHKKKSVDIESLKTEEGWCPQGHGGSVPRDTHKNQRYKNH